jgi:hypothetical protein
MSAIDHFRLEILKEAADLKSFRKSWNVWQPKIASLLPPHADGQALFNFGNHLSEVFLSNKVDGRGQGDLSGGGTAWECLVEWYLNLIFFGTPVIAARRKKAFIPQTILNALSVTIGNNTTNSESDIIVFSVPEVGSLRRLKLNDIDELISQFSTQVYLSVVQCKTNWNDNSQIPMLWDLIYNATGGNRIPNVSVGIKGVTPQSFEYFSYAFASVPTQKKPIKPNSVAVQRVKNLTGGNYWGKQTESNVASSLNEYFGRNFSSFFDGGVQSHVGREIQDKPSYVDAFSNLQFSSLKERI